MISILATPEQGVISGGWSYVWGAYGATWLFLLVYAISLFVRKAETEEVP